VHSRDDPYCDFNDALTLCDRVNGKMIEIEAGGHLTESFGVTKLPQLTGQLEADEVV